MKETSFINQNKEKWNRFEKLYESQSNDPEELSDLYMDITDDLSYAQTFYRRRTVRVYLNQLAQRVYTGVHKQKGESFSKFINRLENVFAFGNLPFQKKFTLRASHFYGLHDDWYGYHVHRP